MKNSIKRILVSLLCVTLLMGDNATLVLCSEIGDALENEIDEANPSEGFVDIEDLIIDDDNSAITEESEDLPEEELVEEVEVPSESGDEFEETEIVINEEEFTAEPLNGATYSLTYTVTNGEATITGYEGTASGDLIIPDTIGGYPVTSIGEEAFECCSGFTGNLTIPNSVKSIGNFAFLDCSNFTGNLTIGNSVTSIGDRAFWECSGFTGNLTIGNSVTSIGEEAFEWCSGFTGNLTIPNSVTSIGDRAFLDCSGFTGNLTIGNSVTSIGEGAFEGCSGFTGNLTIGNSVTSIGEGAFYKCSGFTGNLTIPNGVTRIGREAFYECKGFTGDLTIPNSVKSIGNFAFYECSGFIGTMTIPDSLEEPVWIYGYGVRCVVNNSRYSVHLPLDDGRHYWKNKTTGDVIDVLASGETAIRDDYSETSDKYISPTKMSLTLSSVTYLYGRESVDVLHNAHAIEDYHRPFSLICELAGDDSVKGYELYDGTKKIAESTDGRFENINPANLKLGTNLSVNVIGKNSEYEQNLRLKIKDRASNVPSKIEFGKKLSFTLPDDFPFYGGTTMSFGLPASLPVSAVYEDNKLKIGFNFKESELYHSKDGKVTTNKEKETIAQKFNKWKKNLNKALDAGNKTLEKSNNGIYKYLENPTIKGNIPGIEKKVDFTVIGYIEGTVSEVGLDTMEGEIVVAITGSREVQKTHPLTIGFVTIPVTYNCNVTATGEVTGKLAFDCAQARFVWPDGKVSGKVSVSVEPYAGVGVGKLLSVGVYGKAEVGTNFTLLPLEEHGWNDVYIYGEAGIKGYLAFKEGKWALLSTKELKKMWPKYFDNKNHFLIWSDSHASLMNKNYKPKYTSANLMEDAYCSSSDESMFMEFSMMETAGSFQSLNFDDDSVYIGNAYPAAQPQIAEAGGETVLIFTDYDMSRAEANRTAVKYAIYNPSSGEFGTPVILCDDGTADTNPVVFTDGDDIYCAYQNSHNVYAEGEDPDISDYASTFGISVSKYNKLTGNFDDLGYVSENGKYCYLSSMNMTEDGLIVAWAENENNTFMGMDDANSVFYTVYDGNEFSEPTMLTEKAYAVTDLAVSTKGDISWTVDYDNDYFTTEQVLFINGEEKTTGTIGSLCYCTLVGQSGEVLSYNDNGGISYINGSAIEEYLPEGTMYAGSDFYIYNNGIYYLASGDENRNICASFKNGDTWLTTALTDNDEYIDAFSISGGKAVTLSTLANLDDGAEDISTYSAIKVLSDSRRKLLLADSSYELKDAKPSSNMPVTLSIYNNGTEVIDSVNVDFYCETSEHQLQTVDVTIAPGETKDIVVYVALPDEFNEDYSIEISDPNAAEQDNSGCIDTVSLTQTELSVSTEYVVEKRAEKVAVTVANESGIDAEGELSVTDANGEVLLKKTVLVSAYDSVKEEILVHDIIPKDGLENAITATVSTQQEEYFDYNNTDSVSIWQIEYKPDKFTGEEEEVTNGTSDDSVWQLDESGRSVISKNSESELETAELTTQVWDEENANKVVSLTLDENVSALSKEAITNCENLEKIVILNPECAFEENSIPSETAIRGYYGSTAYTYAKEHEMLFTAIDETTHEHKLDEGVITKEPTNTESGTIKYTCEYCKEEFEEELPSLILPNDVEQENPEDETEYYSVEFDSQGGTLVKTESNIAQGDTISLPSDPYKEGETFAGWYTKTNGKGEKFTEDTPVEGNMILYAFWRKNEGLFIEVAGDEEFEYKGQKITPQVSVYDGKVLLNEKTDYTVTYKNNIKAYTLSEEDEGFNAKLAPSITIKSKGNYAGSETVYFKIMPADISDDAFTADRMAIKANNKAQKPVPALLWNGKSLAAKGNYSISYYNVDETGAAVGEPLTSVKDAGEYVIRLTALGTNFVGTKDIALSVTADKTLVSKLSVGKIANQTYTGSPLEPVLTIKDGKNPLTEGTDYELTYSDNTNVGKACVLIEGKGNYTGVRRVYFNITGIPLSKATVTGISTVPYTGNEIEFNDISLYIKATKTTLQKDLTEGKDYTVSYSKNVNAGTGTVIFTGINGYTGTVKKTFKITAFKLANEPDRISVEMGDYIVYSKGGAKPLVTVKFTTGDGTVKTLTEKTDYTLAYSKNTAVNDCSNPKNLPTVKITLKGSYSGSISKNYSITPKNIETVSLSVNDKTYQNKKNIYASAPALTDTDGKKLAAGKDYDKTLAYTYKNETTVINGAEEVVRGVGDAVDKNDIIPAGTAIKVTATAKAGGNYSGTVSGEYRITKSSISSAKATIPAQIYSGAPITLTKDEIILKVGKDTLTSDDFEIVEGSYRNNVKKGTASLTVKGVGNYGGTKTVNFTIKTKTFIWWWKYDTKLITGADCYTVYFGVNGSLEDVMYIEDIEDYTAAQYKAVTKNKSKWKGAVVVGYKTKKTKYAVATEEVGRVVYD